MPQENINEYIELLKIRLKQEKEINELRDKNIEKLFTKLSCTAFTILIVLMLISFSSSIILTPTMAVLSFLMPTLFFITELCIKDKILKNKLKENDFLVKYNYPNINTNLTNEEILTIVNNHKISNKKYSKNKIKDVKSNDVIDFNNYLKKQIEEYEYIKVRKLTR